MVRTCAGLIDFGLGLQGLKNLSPREKCVCGLGLGFSDHFATFVLIHCLELKSTWKLGGWLGSICFPLQALRQHVCLSAGAGAPPCKPRLASQVGPREELRAADRGILCAVGVGQYQGTRRSCDQPYYGVGAWKVSVLRAF